MTKKGNQRQAQTHGVNETFTQMGVKGFNYQNEALSILSNCIPILRAC
jgi:hypothetical protein